MYPKRDRQKLEPNPVRYGFEIYA